MSVAFTKFWAQFYLSWFGFYGTGSKLSLTFPLSTKLYPPYPTLQAPSRFRQSACVVNTLIPLP